MAPKPKTPAAAPTKAVVNWEEQMAGYATEAASTEQTSGGKFISTRGGRLSYNGAEVPGGKMNVVILDSILENHLYEARFDPDTPASPVCFAFGRTEDELEPHENSATPQCDQCRGCPMNEFGTADTGKGKACKNIRRLALIPEDGLEDLENAEIAFLKVPVTSVKAWSGYVQSLASTLKRPPFGVVTEISVVPDPKTQFRLQFRVADQISDADTFEAVMARRTQAMDTIAFPYQKAEEAPVVAKKVGNSKIAPKAAPKLGRR